MTAPAVRSEGLVVRDLGDELVVYDTQTHRAHCLNRTAARVFRHADGRRSMAELAELLAAQTRAGVDEGIVLAALQRLDEAGLLAGGTVPVAGNRRSRREVLRRVGQGAALLAPVVVSLLVPTPAEAAGGSCIPQNACTNQNIGQPCYVSNPQTECTFKTCQSAGVCQ